MTKTISFELSKRLDELWLLRDIETEYVIDICTNIVWELKYAIDEEDIFWISWYIKTLTTDEAIEFILNNIWDYWSIQLWKNDVSFFPIDWEKIQFYHSRINTQILEKMITYLLDNNLIWHTKIN